jgi:hypothetical protein
LRAGLLPSWHDPGNSSLVDKYLRRQAMSAQDPVVRARHARRPDPPLVVQEAAGLPLDSSFTEQKKILTRCKGLFYGGAEARRFNRMLIDAGLIKNL